MLIWRRAIYTADDYGNFREPDDWRRERGRRRKDPVISKRPQPPDNLMAFGKHDNGRLGMNSNQYFLSKTVKADISRDEDPREALLKYAEEAESMLIIHL